MTPVKILCPMCHQENTSSLTEDTYFSCSHYVWDPIDFPEGPAPLCLDGALVSSIHPLPEEWKPYKASLEALIKGYCVNKDGWLFIESDKKRYEMYAEIRRFIQARGSNIRGTD